MTESTTRFSRRSFLFAVGAGGTVTAAAAVAKSVPEVEVARTSDDKHATRGYHASRHVDAYYRTVKL
jgi:hypothetical protein